MGTPARCVSRHASMVGCVDAAGDVGFIYLSAVGVEGLVDGLGVDIPRHFPHTGVCILSHSSRSSRWGPVEGVLVAFEHVGWVKRSAIVANGGIHSDHGGG